MTFSEMPRDVLDAHEAFREGITAATQACRPEPPWPDVLVYADWVDESPEARDPVGGLAHCLRWCAAHKMWPHVRERYRPLPGRQQGRSVPEKYRYAWYNGGHVGYHRPHLGELVKGNPLVAVSDPPQHAILNWLVFQTLGHGGEQVVYGSLWEAVDCLAEGLVLLHTLYATAAWKIGKVD